MDILGPWHLLFVAAVFVLFFGAKRLPDAARSLGASVRILKRELKETRDQPDSPPLEAPVLPTKTIVAPIFADDPVAPVVPADAAEVPSGHGLNSRA